VGERTSAPEQVEATPTAQAAPAAASPVGATGDLTLAGVLRAQRELGNAKVARLIAQRRGAAGAPRRTLARAHHDVGKPGARPNLVLGDDGPGVALLQRLLGVKQTGVFDAETRKAVDRFQRQQLWDPGGVGPETWKRLDEHEGSPGNRPNLVEGDRGPGVALLQRALHIAPTSYFGKATRAAVDAFQRRQGWDPSGVGPETWKKLEPELVAVDDANREQVAKAMELEADPANPLRAVWHPSHNNASWTDFSKWAMAAKEDPRFSVGASTVLNCWEMVLWTAYKEKLLSWGWIHEVYTYTGPTPWGQQLVDRMAPKGVTTYDRVHATPNPRRGDVVFFDGPAHVALATGVVGLDGPHVSSFWPPPTTPTAPVDHRIAGAGRGMAAGTPDAVKDVSIEALAAACDTFHPPTPCVVTFGAPPW
jgi:peptidoglycan hydrolase-like protein with peptidoglycan-binding domain